MLFSQMLYPQKKQNIETLQTIPLYFCTGRLQKRTAAIICIHTKVPALSQMLAQGVLKLRVFVLPLFHLRIRCTYQHDFERTFGIYEHLRSKQSPRATKAQTLLSSSLPSFFSLDLCSRCLFSPPPSSAWCHYFFPLVALLNFVSPSLPVSPFPLCVVTSLSLDCTGSRDTCGDCLHNRSVIL